MSRGAFYRATLLLPTWTLIAGILFGAAISEDPTATWPVRLFLLMGAALYTAFAYNDVRILRGLKK